MPIPTPWPPTDDELVRLQQDLAGAADDALEHAPWTPSQRLAVAGCFVAFARGEAGPGHPGDRAFAAAVVWRPPGAPRPRRGDEALRGMPMTDEPRRASDVEDQHVVDDRVPASYAPGLLARREGPILAAAIGGLSVRPDVALVDATGRDHPRRAGLALHLGAALDVPTVGVTHRGLTVPDRPPAIDQRGQWTAALDGAGVTAAAWVCTRSHARPLLVHPGWRTGLRTAVDLVLATSTPTARTPVPLQEARRVAREARTIAGAG